MNRTTRVIVALPLLFLIPPLFSDDIPFYKTAKSVQLRPKKIGSDGNGDFTLHEALQLIAEETENPLDPGLVKFDSDEKKQLLMKGKTFWQAIKILEEQWKLHRSALRIAWGRGVEVPPLEGKVIHRRIVGSFRVTMSVTEPRKEAAGAPDETRSLWVELEVEPRLPRCSAMTGGRYKSVDKDDAWAISNGQPMTIRWGNLMRLSYPLVRHFPERFQLKVKLQCFLDWRFRRFGPVEKPEKYNKHKLDRYEFQVRGVNEGEEDGKRWVQVMLFERTALLDSSDLALHLPDGSVVEPSNSASWANAIFRDLPKEVPLSKMQIHLRVPKKAKTTTLTLDYDKEKHK